MEAKLPGGPPGCAGLNLLSGSLTELHGQIRGEYLPPEQLFGLRAADGRRGGYTESKPNVLQYPVSIHPAGHGASEGGNVHGPAHGILDVVACQTAIIGRRDGDGCQ